MTSPSSSSVPYRPVSLIAICLLGAACAADGPRVDPRLDELFEPADLLVRAARSAPWTEFAEGAATLDSEARCDSVLRICAVVAAPEEAAEIPGAGWVERAPGPDRGTLAGLVSALGVDLVRPPDDSLPPTYPLDGSGIVAAVWDPDGPEVDHPDLDGRVLRAPEWDGDTSHATQVGGTLGGTGAGSADVYDGWEPYRWAGVAPGVSFQFWIAGGEPGLPFGSQLVEAITERGADLTSHSYRNEIGGVYGGIAAALDSITRADLEQIDRAVPFFWATANEGDEEGYFSLTDYVAAKNVIAIGASNANDDSLADFSSMGPTADGRLKPEVVAPGCYDTLAIPVEVDAVRVLDASEEPLVQWTFDDDVQGWEAINDLETLTVVSGSLHTTVQGRDPYMHGPEIALSASEAATVEVDFAAGVASGAQLFWRTDGGDWAEERHVDFFLPGSGEVTTIRLELGSHPEWTGSILQLRLDPAVLGVTVPETGHTYISNCGTSIAAPAVAGVAALMLEAWRSSTGEPGAPPPAAYKAALVATAMDLEGEVSGTSNPDLGAPTPYWEGPDFATGYGLVQAPGAVAVFEDERFALRELADEGEELGLDLDVTGGRLQVAAAWDDPEGEPGAQIVLENDLDLVLVAPDGTEHLPWVLDPEEPEAAATRGVDRLNNLEVVTIAVTEAGRWRTLVRADRLDQGPQEVSLVATLDGQPIAWVDEAGDDDDDDSTVDEDGSGEGCACSTTREPRSAPLLACLLLLLSAPLRRRVRVRAPC